MLLFIVVAVVAVVCTGILVIVAARFPDYRNESLSAIGLVVVAAVLLVVLLRPASAAAAGVCNVGMDAFGSAQEPAIVEGYMSALPEFLVSRCLDARGGEIRVITAESEHETAPPVPLDFAPAPGQNVRKAREAAETKIDESIVPEARDLLQQSSRSGAGTDIIGYLATIDHTYQGAPSGRRCLLVLTDGGQTGSPNLYRDPLGAADIDRYIADLDSQGRLPDLSGVDVWVVGVNLGQVATSVPDDRAAQIEAFWRAFFNAAGAHVMLYAATL